MEWKHVQPRVGSAQLITCQLDAQFPFPVSLPPAPATQFRKKQFVFSLMFANMFFLLTVSKLVNEKERKGVEEKQRNGFLRIYFIIFVAFIVPCNCYKLVFAKSVYKPLKDKC